MCDLISIFNYRVFVHCERSEAPDPSNHVEARVFACMVTRVPAGRRWSEGAGRVVMKGVEGMQGCEVGLVAHTSHFHGLISNLHQLPLALLEDDRAQDGQQTFADRDGGINTDRSVVQ